MANRSSTFRKLHRYLGYFLAGIMMLYATSGLLLIFRGTDVLKTDTVVEKDLGTGLSGNEVLRQLRLKGETVEREDADTIVLASGSYDRKSGIATIRGKDYLPVVKGVVHMHKATTKSPLYVLNIAFACSLLFFVVSSFLLFPPSAPALKSGLKVAAGGFLFALAVVVFG